MLHLIHVEFNVNWMKKGNGFYLIYLLKKTIDSWLHPFAEPHTVSQFSFDHNSTHYDPARNRFDIGRKQF